MKIEKMPIILFQEMFLLPPLSYLVKERSQNKDFRSHLRIKLEMSHNEGLAQPFLPKEQ